MHPKITKASRRLCVVLVSLLLGLNCEILSQCAQLTTNIQCVTPAPTVVGASINCTPPSTNGGRRNFQVTGMVAGCVYQISNCGSGFDTQLTIFNSAGVAVGFADDDGPSCAGTSASINFTCPANGTYNIQLNRFNCSTTNQLNGTITVTLLSCGPPLLCSDCTSATPINALPFSGAYTTCGACNSVATGQGCTSPYLGGEDYLFSFTPTVTAPYSIALSGTLTWTGVFVTQGCPTAGGTCVSSNVNAAGNPAINSVALTAGVTYYIIVDTYPAPNCTPFTINVNQLIPPANDLICNATPVTCGQSVNGTTVNATASGTGEGLACGGFTQNQPGVWYSIVGSGSNINASLCGTGWDSRIQVFTGANCNTVNCVGGNDNNGPLCAGNASSFSWLALNGQTYYILVSGATATASAFTLSMACQIPCTANCNGGPAPANDACGGAQNLGAIPTPAACPNGVGNPVNFNLTNVCATAEPNYTSLLGCQPAGNQAAPAADVWYRFTLVAPILNITVNGLGTPNVALYEGTNCANLVPRGCAIGSGGFLNAQIQGLAAGTYYLQVSGGDVLDQCTFTLTLQNNYDCAGCVLAANLDASPPPVNGQYQAGTLVTFCYTITSYQQTSANWLHGVVPTFGPGWDASTFVPLATTTTGGGTGNSCATTGAWSWYNTSVTSSATGAVFGPGFYFETAAGGPGLDGNPGNNFGDNNPGACAWTFCWQIRTKTLANCEQDQGLNVNINTTGDGESGSWTSLACNLDPLVTFFSQSNCCPTPTVTVTNPTCTVLTGSALAQGLGTSPWTYVWRNAAGAVIQTNSTVAGSSNITGLAAGDYTVTVTDATGCSSFVAFSITAPANNTVGAPSSNPTLCVNVPLTPITFTTTGATGIGVATGLPAGVTASFTGNPTAGTITISGTPTANGTFSYSIPLVGGCGNASAAGTITVSPIMTATSSAPNQTRCLNQALSPNIVFNTTGATGIGFPTGLPAGVTAVFAGNATAGTITISGTPTATGTFSYTIPLTGGCGIANATGTITVNAGPTANVVAPTTNPANLCAGSGTALNFSGTPGAALNYTLNGVNGSFSLNLSGNAILAPTSLGLGATWPANTTMVFTSVSTGSGANACITPLNIPVIFSPQPSVTAFSVPANVCSGSSATVNITATPNTIVTFSFNGTATTVNVGATGIASWTSPPLSANATVNYTSIAYATAPFCASLPFTSNNTITVTNSATPTFGPIGPFCFGAAPTVLPATSTNGVSGTWSPAVINTTIVGTTNYTFTPAAGGCGGTPVVVPVLVNERPLVFAHGTNPTCSTLCNGTAVADVTGGLPPYQFSWSNGSLTGSISNLCEGTYTVTVTDANGCQSQAFTPVSGCFQIQSIGADACGDGAQEGLNEMFFIQIGASPLNLLTATVAWPSNTFTNFNCANAAFIAAANATITAGGTILPVPAGGILPANANVVIMTSSTPNIAPNTFANVSDTLYMAFHCSTNPTGYFLNGGGSGTRTLSMTFSAGCTDLVTYNVASLANSNGAYVNFSQTGTATYLDYDCVAPFSVQDNSVVIDAPDPVTPTFNPVGPFCSGAAIAALPTSSTNTPAITGAWSPSINNAATTTYTFTPDPATQCATSTQLTITITPVNATAGPNVNPTLCLGDLMPNIIIPTTGATGIGVPSGLPLGVTAVWAGNIITISGTPTAAGVFNYSIPLTGGCGNVNAIGTITVNSPQSVTLGYGGPFCVLSGSASPNNSWTGGGVYTALPATLVINASTGVINLATSPPGTYDVTFRPTGCGQQVTTTVVLNAPPVAAVIPTDNICSGSSTNLPLTSSPAGATFSWTQTSVVATGASNGSGSAINQVLQVPGLVQGTVTYTITPSLNGCVGLPVVSTITVRPTPQALAAAPIIPPCIGGGTQLLANNVPGATYNWTGPNNFVSSLEDPTINNLVAASEGTYQLIVTLNGCSDTATALLNIDDPTTINLIYPESPFCASDGIAIPTVTWAGGGFYTANPALVFLDDTTGEIDLEASGPGTYTIAFGPLGCASPTTTTIVIEQQTIPTFNPIPLICFGTAAPSLPSTSINGISGTWNPATISNTASGTYTFTPDADECASPITLDTEVSTQVVVDGIFHD